MVVYSDIISTRTILQLVDKAFCKCKCNPIYIAIDTPAFITNCRLTEI